MESSISDKEQVKYILYSLGLECNIFCTAVQVQPVLPNLQELKAKLLQHEVQYTEPANEPAHAVIYTGQPAVQQKDARQHVTYMGMGRGCGDMMGKGLLPTPYGMTGQSRGCGNPPTCFLYNKKRYIKANC